jgi:5-amino-6-(5-phospho-D-ribitylamino)uracil phosphatase
LIKLIAIDVDGTLLDSRGKIPAANLEAIHGAVSRGVKVVIATGRSFHFCLQAIGALPDDITLILHNGAICAERGGTRIFRNLLPRSAAREVLEATSAWRKDTTAAFDRPAEGQLVYDRMDWTHPNRRRFKERNHAIIQEVARLEDSLVEDPIQIAFNGGVADMRAVAALLGGHTIAPQLEIALTEYPDRDFSMVDVCAAGTTKGTSLAALAALFDIPQACVMAVGDNHNDRAMLEWAGTGVVMGNADPELQAAGFHRTATNDDAGLAQAINRFANPRTDEPMNR